MAHLLSIFGEFGADKFFFKTEGEQAEVTDMSLLTCRNGAISAKYEDDLHLSYQSQAFHGSPRRSRFYSTSDREQHDLPHSDVSSISLASFNPRGQLLTL